MQPDDRQQQRHRFGLILLAAGGSSRLGSPKQLVLFQGKSLLRHAAETAAASDVASVTVVLGSRAGELSRELAGLNVHCVVNPGWEEGMSSSIRAGIALVEKGDFPAVLLMLCDQPHVTVDFLNVLVSEFETSGKAIAVSDYGDDTLGPPCLFARSLFPELSRLRGAQGAKQIWKDRPASEIARVGFRLGRVDIDTPEDVARLEAGRGG